MATKDDIIAQQAKQIADLLDRITDLELQLAKALKNSFNSSKSPSSDIVKPPKKQIDRRKKAKRVGRPKLKNVAEGDELLPQQHPSHGLSMRSGQRVADRQRTH